MEKRHSTGFTLIELMIVVAILGILSGIALTSYDRNVTKTRRSDAMGALTGLANAMERYRTENGTYVGAALGAGGIYENQSPISGTPKFYDLTIDAADENTFTLSATPINAQTGNGLIQLTNTNIRRWDENNDGNFDGPEEFDWNEG